MEARQQDMDALAALFAEGFQRDPLFCHYIPYEQEREGILKQIFLKYLNDYWEVLTVLEVPPLAGAMCIYPSGAQGTERMVLPAHIRKVYDRINQVAAPQFYEDYLTLDLLAVRPEFRDRGIARALVDALNDFTARHASQRKAEELRIELGKGILTPQQRRRIERRLLAKPRLETLKEPRR